MATAGFEPIARLRRPEYTGENRCLPCTSVNVVIAVGLSAVLGLALASITSPAVAGGIAVLAFALSLASIYFRGYLVPGTPTLTQRYFPPWLLALFDKDDDADVSEATIGSAAEADDPVEPEPWLLEHEVLVPCADVDDLCFPDDVHAAYHEAFDRVREGDLTDRLADFLDVDADGLTLDTDGRHTVRHDGRFVGRWTSDVPLVADLAAADVLDACVPAWQELTPRERSSVAGGLRAFADSCPLCGKPISFDQDERNSCCGRTKLVYSIGCGACEETLIEHTETVRAADGAA